MLTRIWMVVRPIQVAPYPSLTWISSGGLQPLFFPKNQISNNPKIILLITYQLSPLLVKNALGVR